MLFMNIWLKAINLKGFTKVFVLLTAYVTYVHLGPVLGQIFDNIRSLSVRTWAHYSAAQRDWLMFCISMNANYLQKDFSVTLSPVSGLMEKNLADLAFF